MAEIGNESLLQKRKLALLCSRVCPGSVIMATLDAVRLLCGTPWVVISGFQSPTEKECLELLLRAEHPVIVCPARSVVGMRLSPAWRTATAAGRMLVTSPFDEKLRRATATLAEERNRFVVSLSDAVFIPHAARDGSLDRLCRTQMTDRMQVWTIDHESNGNLFAIGALPFSVSSLDGSDR